MQDTRCGVLRRIVTSGVLICAALAASARTRPHYGGVLRVEIHGDAWSTDGLARRLVLNTLTNLDADGAAQPALAANWSEQNNEQRWDFRLRPGVQFQDGSLLTAAAVADSLKAPCSSGGGEQPACPWKTVSAVGTSEVVMTTAIPEPDFPELLAQTRFAISKKDAEGTIVGTGPFKVAGLSGDVLTLTANGQCWEGRPFLDSVEIMQYRSVRDQWMDLSVGRADIVQVPPEMLPEARDKHLNLLVSRPVDLLALTIAEEGEFSSLKMRQAAALAVDRSALYGVIFQEQGDVTASLLPQWLSGYSFLFSTDRDLSQAETLRGSTYRAPVGMRSEISGAIFQLAAARLALDLNEAGFHVQMSGGGARPALELRRVHLEETDPRAALDEVLHAFGENVTVNGANPHALWQAEHKALQTSTVVPLLWLPRGWAYGPRVRDLQLSADGEPMLANASLEDTK